MKESFALRIVTCIFVGIVLFSIGRASNGKQYIGDNPQLNLEFLYAAYTYKAALLDRYEELHHIVNQVLSAHMDDGKVDDLIDELDELGYYNVEKSIDELYKTQE